jgi:hypothetical protein
MLTEVYLQKKALYRCKSDQVVKEFGPSRRGLQVRTLMTSQSMSDEHESVNAEGADNLIK